MIFEKTYTFPKWAKRVLISCTIFTAVILIFLLCILLWVHLQTTSKYYEKNLRTELQTHGEVSVGEIFDFEFDRAYVFLPELCYYSGEDLSEAYGLGLSIDQVKKGHADSVGRIVFVNESGEYVYLFKYNQWSSLIVAQSEKGQIIYPETVIKLISTERETLFIDFLSDSYYVIP